LTTLALIMARLRGPDGCPWDAKQTHESLGKHLVEESLEVLQAIDAGDTGEDLADELGDLLLQVAFHAQLAADEDRFDLSDVGRAINSKLVRRHPHVFGDVEVADADEVLKNWGEIKSREKPGRAKPVFDESSLERGLQRLLDVAKKKGVDPLGPLQRTLGKYEASE
jgi:tetrapyrrole methylase family protein/MazG family protein